MPKADVFARLDKANIGAKAKAQIRFTEPFPRTGLRTESATKPIQQLEQEAARPRGFYLIHCNHGRLLILPCQGCNRSNKEALRNAPAFANGKWAELRARF